MWARTMCGIAGIVSLRGESIVPPVLKRMTDRIAHRGPDGEGHYFDGPVGLGHRRLAVIDLSAAGHQPMASENGDVVVTYNGEIYNFQTLRVELEAHDHRFHSQTDSEVVVHAYEQWGRSCVDRFNGMFAFAVWDRSHQRLWLVRDRYGIKPLYWYCDDQVFIFASEIKAILEHPRVSARVCYPALNEYFSFQNIFSDLTLFEGVRLLQPGHTITLDLAQGGTPQQTLYWDYAYAAGHTTTASPADWTDQVRQAIVTAVHRQLVSDVSVGAYLSGGIDSGSITSVAARQLKRLTTFTAGFDLSSASGLELGFDERSRAESLSNLLKTEHYEVVLHAGDMEWVLPELIWHLEDLRVGQCYPNYYVARLAGKFVKVVLSGAGGDELFGGYPWRYYRGLNSNGRGDYYTRYYRFWQRLITETDKPRFFTRDTRRRVNGVEAFDVFRAVFDGWTEPLETNADYVRASLYFELKTFLHGLLVVEDKLSMAHGLETRLPFLDNDLVDLALRVPVELKLSNLADASRLDENLIGKRWRVELETTEGKIILRHALKELLPGSITDRTKQGFSAPDGSWFRGESIDYINRLLRDPKARIFDYVERDFVGGVLDQHCSGRVNRRLLIWSLLSFEWWCRRFLG